MANQSTAPNVADSEDPIRPAYLVGSVIMGMYLLISLNAFGRHSNEAFSSLHIPDWKSFLRLRIHGDGTLSILPVGIRRVPRKWKASPDKSGPRMLPDDPAGTSPALIEPPIVVMGPRAVQARISSLSDV